MLRPTGAQGAISMHRYGHPNLWIKTPHYEALQIGKSLLAMLANVSEWTLASPLLD
jgi:hypothetical protein